jgi:hypothetical protein
MRYPVGRFPEAARGLILLAALPLLSACNRTSTHREDLVDMLQDIRTTRLRTHVDALTGIGPRPADNALATERTLAYLSGQLRAMGYEPIEEAVPVAGGAASDINLIAERAGADPAILEIGAHYDTVPDSPGADDNASGVAALLEVARQIAKTRTRRTLRLIFFAAEEPGLRGSTGHVARIRRRGDDIAGTIVLEMIGYATDRPDSQASPARIPLLFWPPTRGNFITVVGNLASGGLGNRFESTLRRQVPRLPLFSINRLGALFKDAMRSDHKPYWDAGLRAIMLTDTAEFRNPNYHRPSDLPMTLNYEFLRQTTQAVAATALTWAGMETNE